MNEKNTNGMPSNPDESLFDTLKMVVQTFSDGTKAVVIPLTGKAIVVEGDCCEQSPSEETDETFDFGEAVPVQDSTYLDEDKATVFHDCTFNGPVNIHCVNSSDDTCCSMCECDSECECECCDSESSDHNFVETSINDHLSMLGEKEFEFPSDNGNKIIISYQMFKVFKYDNTNGTTAIILNILVYEKTSKGKKLINSAVLKV